MRFPLAWVFFLPLAGCGDPQVPATGQVAALSVGELMGRTVDAYSHLTTLHARGVLRDFRRGRRRIEPIRWDFARPDRCRLQVGMDVMIVSGEAWWSYRDDRGRYSSHKPFTRTPIETAAFLLSEDVPLLLPALLTKPAEALGASAAGRFPGWTLRGVGFVAGKPCYVLLREDFNGNRPSRLRLWLDQTTLLLRGWTLSRVRGDGGERVLVGCDYAKIVADGKLPENCFQLLPPAPIPVPADAASVIRD